MTFEADESTRLLVPYDLNPLQPGLVQFNLFVASCNASCQLRTV